ncbi:MULTISPECIES: hypothetical protein [unclassified Bradyrhizobium]|jgi:hypothetical protein|uniref:hypothetical protein n=1 Tax=unclassified Bradyrhizobium TaxID=2631580 RepID=UPI001FE09FD2|nr:MULTISPECIES: hypothetical protein [unclassified Bradyrhizobium]
MRNATAAAGRGTLCPDLLSASFAFDCGTGLATTRMPRLQDDRADADVAAAAVRHRRLGRLRDDRIVIRSEGLATDFDTLLRACRDCHAASSPRTALQQEDERRPQGFEVQGFEVKGSAYKASPYKCHKIAAPGSLCCIAGWTYPRECPDVATE